MFISIKLIPPKYLETRITKIGRAVYLTEIRMLHSLNRQYHSRINQRPVVQGLVNISMLILWTQHLLLKTLPDLHPKHLFLITRVKNLSATSYLFYYFICFIAIWLWTFNKNRGNGNDRFLIATILLLIEFFFFFDLDFTLVILWRNIPEINPFQDIHFQSNASFL